MARPHCFHSISEIGKARAIVMDTISYATKRLIGTQRLSTKASGFVKSIRRVVRSQRAVELEIPPSESFSLWCLLNSSRVKFATSSSKYKVRRHFGIKFYWNFLLKVLRLSSCFDCPLQVNYSKFLIFYSLNEVNCEFDLDKTTLYKNERVYLGKMKLNIDLSRIPLTRACQWLNPLCPIRRG